MESSFLRHVNGHKLTARGVHIWLTSSSSKFYSTIKLDVYAGNAYANNALNVTIESETNEHTAFPTFGSLRAILLAATETYDAVQGLVCPLEISNLWADSAGGTQMLDLAWMTYVAPRFAYLVTPPSGAIVEYRADGGLYMAATGETFRTANPGHLAAARRIRDSLTAYNEIPWTLKTGE